MTKRAERLLLTTSAAAELLGVHPSTIKRWSDEGTISSAKTQGGHRRIHLTDILELARERGISTPLDPFRPWEANVWLAVSAAAGSDGFHRLIGLALGWLARGEIDLLSRLFFEVGRREEIPFTRFLDEGVRGFMASVGDEWRKGRLQVGEEHMATQVVLDALSRLRITRESALPPSPWPIAPRPVAVVGRSTTSAPTSRLRSSETCSGPKLRTWCASPSRRRAHFRTSSGPPGSWGTSMNRGPLTPWPWEGHSGISPPKTWERVHTRRSPSPLRPSSFNPGFDSTTGSPLPGTPGA
jgi:excisionase family DNA binding protein